MDPFTIAFVSGLLTNFTTAFIKGAGRKISKSILGTEKEQAVNKCLNNALVAFLATAKTASKTERDLLDDIFRSFFRDDDVAHELSALLEGALPDRKELQNMFRKSGYVMKQLPGFEFDPAMDAFQRAFITTAAEEKSLQEIIKINYLMKQTGLQGDMLTAMKQMIEYLAQIKEDTLKIRGDRQLSGQNLESGKQIDFQIPVIVIRQDTAPAEKTASLHLRESYLNYLFETCRNLSLAGIDPKAASQATSYLHLDSVYTALRTLTPESHEKWMREEFPEKDTRYLSAVEQLNKEAHLVLLGDPGSGKSTFVNFVTLCLAGELLGNEEANLKLLTAPLPVEEREEKEQEPRPQPWEHRGILPLRIILRDFAARGLPDSEAKATANHLWQFIVAELKSTALEEYAPYLKKTLRQTGGLLLLDGLDEVPEAQRRRNQIKQAVEDFKAAYPKCRLIITSRTFAYQKQDWRLPDFSEAVLAPFSPAQVNRFVESWYHHIGILRGWHSDEYQGRAVLLKNAIAKSRSLQELAGRPLLLTLMASLHAWRGGSLPEKREQLYNDTVDLLLDWWEMPKTVRDADSQVTVLQPSLAEWLKIDRQKVRKLLHKLAFEAHAAQPELLGTADIAENALVGGLLQLSQNPDVKPQRLVEYLSQRAGLLIPRGVGVYTFPHRTFQEYLAACYLTDHDFPDKIAALACEDPNRWREVLLLAGAKAARGAEASIWNLVDALCYEECGPDNHTPGYLWGAHLAGQALVEGADLSHMNDRQRRKLEKVQAWLVNILAQADFPAIERAATGMNLAKLGDTREAVLRLEKMVFCLVPGGDFWMGSPKDDEMAWDDEKHFHQNDQLNTDYWISCFPVSNAQFNEFVTVGGYGREKYWPEAKEAGYWQDGKVRSRYDENLSERPIDYGEPFNLANHPVVGVTWFEALAFTRWLSEKWQQEGLLNAGWEVRLPSEGQWEKAVRGGEKIPSAPVIRSVKTLSMVNYQLPIGNSQLKMVNNPDPRRRYPWGNDPDPNRANYADSKIGSTSAVGCFSGGISVYGCEEMSGNVLEWCLTKWRDNYKEKADETLDGESSRVLRGGAFYGSRRYVRCACRDHLTPGGRDHYIGFRVVLSP